MGHDLDRIWGFLTPEQKHRHQQAELATAKALYERCGEKWDCRKTKFAERIALDGKHYAQCMKQLHIFPDKPVKLDGSVRIEDACRKSPGGEWGYANRILPAWHWLSIMQGHREGRVVFNTNVSIPTLLALPRCTTVSSCTPMEMFTQRQGIRRSTGTVLVGGLGLGWFLRLVSAKKSVKRIILVEKSQDLLDWYGRELCERIAKETDTPIEVICDDVWAHIGEHGDDVRHMVDIWEGYPTYHYELAKDHQALIARVKYFWGWGLLAEPLN
jgi:hypothetical protein